MKCRMTEVMRYLFNFVTRWLMREIKVIIDCLQSQYFVNQVNAKLYQLYRRYEKQCRVLVKLLKELVVSKGKAFG